MADKPIKTVFEQWKTYRHDVIPKDAHPIQVQECQLAFYGGAAYVYGILGSIADTDDEDEESTVKLLEQLGHDLEAFLTDYRKRHGLKKP